MTARMLFRGLLFYVGFVLFGFSSVVLFFMIWYLGDLPSGISLESTDSQIQIAIIKKGFLTLVFIGLEIISILLMGFFKDWDKEEPKN